jgi:DNA-binding CsgD family transcriptional regulator
MVGPTSGDGDDENSGEVEKPTAEPHSGDGPRVSRMRVGGEEIIVLSVPLPKLRYPEGTTQAEQEIIDLVLEGLTVREIAEKRGVSARTVTTQLGVIFRKAGVNSQAELIAVMTAQNSDD